MGHKSKAEEGLSLGYVLIQRLLQCRSLLVDLDGVTMKKYGLLAHLWNKLTALGQNPLEKQSGVLYS